MGNIFIKLLPCEDLFNTEIIDTECKIIMMEVIDLNVFLPDSIDYTKTSKISGTIVQIRQGFFAVYVNLCTSINEKYEDCEIYFNKHNDNTYSKNHLEINFINNYFDVVKLVINCCNVKTNTIKNKYISFYNCEAFKKSERFPIDVRDDLNQFDLLKSFTSKCELIDLTKETDILFHQSKYLQCGFPKTMVEKLKGIMSYSNLFSHLFDIVHLLKWGIYSIYRNKKITVKVGNLFFALFLNLIVGTYILYRINQWSPSIVYKTFELIDVVFPSLQRLFNWLMGSPAGLKLNHAFNTMLGNFFLYHIELWRMFLDIFRNALESTIQVFKYVGIFGITFQTAFLADLLSLASLHIYSIYVYAARLYDLQVNGLLALWKLFIGRKRNPLRSIVDSCLYNHHQLFIGTLGFTILLFLLPTTILYYAAFTAFRLVQLTIGELLKWIQFLIQSAPIYLVILWLMGSSKLASDIKISVKNDFNLKSKLIVLNVELETPPLLKLMKLYKPDPITTPRKLNFSELLSNLLWGKVMSS